ncbi:DUF2147 domain-containing protein [Nereida sp. MMG025]|uniref:DUF2147 domain-containing protein n=1 Tax=Nereida sp. MMG025 TaxID=2909981 RepID=UPI001F3C2D69|nr:DUF2147 domain-containing protein [Nereida sp. MMG025]MCF6445209.1 DUF2147 domain-containing protein [Nereida sp. MMG025]
MRLKKTLLAFLFYGTLGVPALAETSVIGIWKTEPDRKDYTAHIEISKCADSYCGKVLRAFDANGNPAVTPNVGRQIFWDVKALGDNEYGAGRVWVPMLDTSAKASMKLEGQALRVRGCKGPVCDSQVWQRVQ